MKKAYRYKTGRSLESIPEGVLNDTELTSIDISNQVITTIPPSISKLTNLEFLTLQYLALTSIPEEIYELTNITHLNFSGNHIAHISNSITKLQKLEVFFFTLVTKRTLEFAMMFTTRKRSHHFHHSQQV